jgi:hypothetical protein
MRLTDVTNELGMGCAALRIVQAGIAQAQLAINGQANLGGIHIFLTVIFPPANRAESHNTWSLQGL